MKSWGRSQACGGATPDFRWTSTDLAACHVEVDLFFSSTLTKAPYYQDGVPSTRPIQISTMRSQSYTPPAVCSLVSVPTHRDNQLCHAPSASNHSRPST